METVSHLLQDLVVIQQKFFSNGFIQKLEPVLEGSRQHVEEIVQIRMQSTVDPHLVSDYGCDQRQQKCRHD